MQDGQIGQNGQLAAKHVDMEETTLEHEHVWKDNVKAMIGKQKAVSRMFAQVRKEILKENGKR